MFVNRSFIFCVEPIFITNVSSDISHNLQIYTTFFILQKSMSLLWVFFLARFCSWDLMSFFSISCSCFNLYSPCWRNSLITFTIQSWNFLAIGLFDFDKILYNPRSVKKRTFWIPPRVDVSRDTFSVLSNVLIWFWIFTISNNLPIWLAWKSGSSTVPWIFMGYSLSQREKAFSMSILYII